MGNEHRRGEKSFLFKFFFCRGFCSGGLVSRDVGVIFGGSRDGSNVDGGRTDCNVEAGCQIMDGKDRCNNISSFS